MRHVTPCSIMAESPEIDEGDREHLAAALAQAMRGRDEGGIPIGAVLVHRGKIIGAGHNRRVQVRIFGPRRTW